MPKTGYYVVDEFVKYPSLFTFQLHYLHYGMTYTNHSAIFYAQQFSEDIHATNFIELVHATAVTNYLQKHDFGA